MDHAWPFGNFAIHGYVLDEIENITRFLLMVIQSITLVHILTWTFKYVFSVVILLITKSLVFELDVLGWIFNSIERWNVDVDLAFVH